VCDASSGSDGHANNSTHSRSFQKRVLPKQFRQGRIYTVDALEVPALRRAAITAEAFTRNFDGSRLVFLIDDKFDFPTAHRPCKNASLWQRARLKE
jgi:hypothetical protein